MPLNILPVKSKSNPKPKVRKPKHEAKKPQHR
ncbi:MAG: hypothetical protein QOE61_4596 [Micromonosporaceae bacterium]|jgi:hypothetical protein|nr:hypothetical protein [Micromonosporaceae bacterium]